MTYTREERFASLWVGGMAFNYLREDVNVRVLYLFLLAMSASASPALEGYGEGNNVDTCKTTQLFLQDAYKMLCVVYVF